MNHPTIPNKKHIIPRYVHDACELVFDGLLTSDQIAVRLMVKYGVDYAGSTIRWWFYKSGPWVDYYDEYAHDQANLRTELAQNLFIANAKKAAIVLMKVMNGDGDMAQVNAAKEWLDRSLGKVTAKASLSVASEKKQTFADWTKQETLKGQNNLLTNATDNGYENE